MYFSNREVEGTITEARRGLSTIFKTAGGNVAYAPSTQPRGFTFTINTYLKETIFKLDYLNEAIRQGWRVEFWILEGYFTYSGAINDFVASPAQAILPYAVVEYNDGEARHRQIKRGYGLVHGAETQLTIYEGFPLAIPASPQAGSQEVDTPSGTV